jgi:hypothetical protein
MSSWSCPYFDEVNDWCRRLNTDCVPGRKGCILPCNLRYAVSPEERAIKKKAERLGVHPDQLTPAQRRTAR